MSDENSIENKQKVILIKETKKSEETPAVVKVSAEKKKVVRKKVVVKKVSPSLSSDSDLSSKPLELNNDSKKIEKEEALKKSAVVEETAKIDKTEEKIASLTEKESPTSFKKAELPLPSEDLSEKKEQEFSDSKNVESGAKPMVRNFAENIRNSRNFNDHCKEVKQRRKAEADRFKEGEQPAASRHFKPKTPFLNNNPRVGNFSGRNYEGVPRNGFGQRPFPPRNGEGGTRNGFQPRQFGQQGQGRSGNFNAGTRPPRFGNFGGLGQRPFPPRNPNGSGGFGFNQRGGDVPPPDIREEGKKHHNKRFYKSKKKEFDATEFEDEKAFLLHEKKSIQQKANPVPKEIDILDVISVSELARKMNLKAADLIGKLLSMGVMATINQQIDADTAIILAEEFDCKVNLVSLYDETLIEKEEDHEEDLKPRPPIITVMGHVDHGKTKTLDAIRSTNKAEGEHGGITQHIGAYKVMKNGHELTFLDTPGHAAFSLMRARGAKVTDMVVLVVAANDGVMPQTVEAINHAKEAKVPIVVAVNKCDLQDANVDRVKQQLSEYDLIPEDWGGSTLYVQISALKKQGIDDLLDTIILQAEMMDLKANFNCRAEGKVIESRVEQGRGIVSTIIVERGTLKVGDAYVAGVFYGKIRALFNDKGESVKTATPSTPVEITGLTGIPDAGSPFQVTATEKEAKSVASKRQELDKLREAKNVKKITLDNLYDTIQDSEVKELKVIVKGDVHGSVEAVKSALDKLGNDEIRINVIHHSAGAILESDVSLASASNAIIIGFNVRPTPKTQLLAEKEKVEIRKYTIIYDVIEDMNEALEGMLSPDLEDEVVGEVEVRDIFKVPKVGTIAGCYLTSGFINRNCKVHVIRDSVVIFTGDVSSLKRFKDDVKEVKEGYECGIGIADFNDIQVGDLLEVYMVKEIKKHLEPK